MIDILSNKVIKKERSFPKEARQSKLTSGPKPLGTNIKIRCNTESMIHLKSFKIQLIR